MGIENRHSGMELLRIFAMALVVLAHLDFWALGYPSSKMCATDMQHAAYQYFVEFFSLVCVNCYIFISGWFSIKFKVRGLANLLFQIFFYNILIYLICVITSYVPLSFKHFISHLNVLTHWFIPAYIALYLLSPILNLFIENASKRQSLLTVAAFVFLDVFMGWVHDYLGFNGGYSVLHFMVIYLIARYIKIHGGKAFSFNKKWDLLIYFLISFLVPLMVVVSYYKAPFLWRGAGKLFWYNNPLIIISSVYFSLYFTKLKFHSKLVNIVGASSFAVYLIHTDNLVRVWCITGFSQSLFYSHNVLFFSVATLLLLVALFIVATVVDQIRKRLWLKIQSLI